MIFISSFLLISFKSAFIIFSAEKHKEIKEKLANEGRVEKVRV